MIPLCFCWCFILSLKGFFLHVCLWNIYSRLSSHFTLFMNLFLFLSLTPPQGHPFLPCGLSHTLLWHWPTLLHLLVSSLSSLLGCRYLAHTSGHSLLHFIVSCKYFQAPCNRISLNWLWFYWHLVLTNTLSSLCKVSWLMPSTWGTPAVNSLLPTVPARWALLDLELTKAMLAVLVNVNM